MPIRPSKLWKQMPIEARVAAAEAFWRDASQAEGMHEQHVEAIFLIAQRLKFRPKSVQALPVERRAKQLAHLPDVSDAIATRALVAYHLAAQRPMMGAFLDALGVPHEEGLIADEAIKAPLEKTKAAEAAASLTGKFPAGDVTLYLNTLLTQDPDTWGILEGLPELAWT